MTEGNMAVEKLKAHLPEGIVGVEKFREDTTHVSVGILPMLLCAGFSPAFFGLPKFPKLRKSSVTRL